jgi:mono/diheme cytochrome c family protein
LLTVSLAAVIALRGAPAVAVADSGPMPEAAMKEAQEIFSTRCSACHGATGKGDGPGSAALNPKPRNLSEPAWQNSVNDDYIEKIVQYGGAAVGKSPMMPGNPDLISKPDVVKGIRATVRGLAQKQ